MRAHGTKLRVVPAPRRPPPEYTEAEQRKFAQHRRELTAALAASGFRPDRWKVRAVVFFIGIGLVVAMVLATKEILGVAR